MQTGYWKPGYLALTAKPCPVHASCANGSSPNGHYTPSDNATCAPGRGVTGVYCLLCSEPRHYYDLNSEQCQPCANELATLAAILGSLLLLAASMALAARHLQTMRKACATAWHSIVVTSRQISLPTKLKITISYYQIITQINRVYAITPPPAYAKLMRVLDIVFNVVFGWIPGIATECTGLSLANELLLVTFLPPIIVLAGIGLAVCRGTPILSTLPFALVASFLCFPYIASRGFRALAPCDCFDYVDADGATGNSTVCFLRDAYSVSCQVREGSGAYTVSDDIKVSAWLAIIIYACVVPVIYCALLLVCRPSLRGVAPPTALSRAMLFLCKEYNRQTFWWELVEVARKLVLTGYLALVKPGTLLQLYLGLTFALCMLILQLYAAPYRSVGDNFLSAVSASALVLTLLASLGIQLTELKSELTQLGQQLTGLGLDDLSIIVVVNIAAALLVLLLGLGMFAEGVRNARRLPIARWASDGTVAMPRTLPAGRFHAFISHQWATGQDQARAIKAQLTAMLPGLRVFLDVDNLDSISKLEDYIDSTDAVIVFLAGTTIDGAERSDYMRSGNCVRELRRAVEMKKAIIFVHETDPQHGAVSMATHLRDCPPELRHALDEHPCVPWYRVKAFAQISLRQMAEVMLDGQLRIPGEMLYAPLRLSPVEPGAYHLYVPRGSAAEAVAQLLHNEAAASRTSAYHSSSHTLSTFAWTSDPSERGQARCFLLHLHRQTWESDSIEAEVTQALDDGMTLLLVHEQRNEHDPVPFSAIIERTPPALVERKVYQSLAVPLYHGDDGQREHQRVCLRLMLQTFEAAPSARWRPSWPHLQRAKVTSKPVRLLESSQPRKSLAAAPDDQAAGRSQRPISTKL